MCFWIIWHFCVCTCNHMTWHIIRARKLSWRPRWRVYWRGVLIRVATEIWHFCVCTCSHMTLHMHTYLCMCNVMWLHVLTQKCHIIILKHISPIYVRPLVTCSHFRGVKFRKLIKVTDFYLIPWFTCVLFCEQCHVTTCIYPTLIFFILCSHALTGAANTQLTTSKRMPKPLERWAVEINILKSYEYTTHNIQWKPLVADSAETKFMFNLTYCMRLTCVLWFK